MPSPNNISRYISFTLVSSLKVGEKRIREGLILFELINAWLTTNKYIKDKNIYLNPNLVKSMCVVV